MISNQRHFFFGIFFFSTIIFWFKKYLMNFKFSKFVNSPCQVLFPWFCQVKRQFLRNLVRLKVVCSFILYWGGGGEERHLSLLVSPVSGM